MHFFFFMCVITVCFLMKQRAIHVYSPEVNINSNERLIFPSVQRQVLVLNKFRTPKINKTLKDK